MNGQEIITPEEQIGQTTIQISGVKNNNKTIYGSGFIFKFSKNNIDKIFLVTNKHVTTNLKSMTLVSSQAYSFRPSIRSFCR